ncbi:TonB-dependent receptor [Sphingomonas sp. ACRSK]|uniref:TonB-dependent receptor n=1 Tax=Sphingomonas sp. ACRSK TaxID=2918213 RepID=UPI001EF71CAF|nr:TonB-dependent receptor [Sphingomonas sp. ACRSK]MCG7349612.1 TonB-dependent receptor [Sphingomonas sp. ACRSK]
MTNRFLYGTAVATVVAAFASLPARAQQSTPPAASTEAAEDTAAGSEDEGGDVVVIGSAFRNQEAVQNRRQALGVVDTLTQDDTGDLADETLAEALIRVPGVSSVQTLYGEQEAAYVSVRGISPDLNYTSFDGLAMFSSANDGDGLRRVDLNLIPTQISRTTEVYKTFTSDLDSGAIGGATNIVPRSALNDKDTFYIDAQAILQTGYGKYVPGSNSLGNYRDRPLGVALKSMWAKKFGSDNQFGFVLSGVYRERNFDYTKRNANGRVFYTSTGAVARTDLSNWDGLHPLPSLVRPMDYTHYTRTLGGSAQFEYSPAPGLEMSILGYYYKQVEDQTFNQFLVENYTNLVRLSPEVARLKIGRTRPSYDYDRFENETRGAIGKVVKDFEDGSSLQVRAGYLRNTFYDLDLNAAYAYNPPNSFITYDMTELSDRISIDNNADLINIANYRLLAASDLTVNARMRSLEGRIDYKRNYAFNSEGFGFAVGADVRQVKAVRDSGLVTYTSNNSPLGALGFVPDISSYMYEYPVIWIDYAGFQQTVKPTLAVNQTATNNSAFSDDYGYRERVAAGYVSGMYATGGLRVTAGVRYDDVRFKADSPVAVGGVYNGTFARKTGGYRHFLPSLLVTNAFSDAIRLKAGYSRTLGRPAFGDIARAESRNVQNLTISRGNPDLRPRRSDNFDLAAEYFFDQGGLISFGGFYKTIKDDIYTTSSEQVIDGVTYLVSQPNNASSATMRGLEFQIVTDRIPRLPGFLRDKVGMSFNLTRMWADSRYVSGGAFVDLDALQFQANWLVNAGVFYRLPANGEFRIAYNWKSRSPISLGANALTTYWLEGREQLDASLRVGVTKNVLLKLQANNILEEPVRQVYVGPYAMRRYELTRPRTFAADVVVRF